MIRFLKNVYRLVFTDSRKELGQTMDNTIPGHANRDAILIKLAQKTRSGEIQWTLEEGQRCQLKHSSVYTAALDGVEYEYMHMGSSAAPKLSVHRPSDDASLYYPLLERVPAGRDLYAAIIEQNPYENNTDEFRAERKRKAEDLANTILAS